MADEEFLRQGILQLLSNDWTPAKDLHKKLQEHVGQRIRIFKVKSLCRSLFDQGVEMERLKTKFGYPDEHFRLKEGTEVEEVSVPKRVLEREWSRQQKKQAQRVLDNLVDVAGVLGALVVTDDNKILADNMGYGVKKDTLAEVSIAMIQAAWSGLAQLGHEEFERFTVRASDGRLLFVDLGFAYLVVVIDSDIDLGQIGIEADSAANRLKGIEE